MSSRRKEDVEKLKTGLYVLIGDKPMKIEDLEKEVADGYTENIEDLINDSDEKEDALRYCNEQTRNRVQRLIDGYKDPRVKQEYVIDNLNGQLDAVKQQLKETESKLSAAEDQVEDRDEKIKELEAKIKELEAKIKELEAKIKELEANATSEKADPVELAEAKAKAVAEAERADKAETEVASEKDRADKAEAKVKIESSRADKAEAELKKANGEIASLNAKLAAAPTSAPVAKVTPFADPEPISGKDEKGNPAPAYLFYNGRPFNKDFAKALIKEFPDKFKESEFTYYYSSEFDGELYPTTKVTFAKFHI
jgi:chromosome segregation ATPase